MAQSKLSSASCILPLGLVLGSCQSPPDSDLLAANAALAPLSQNRILSQSCFAVAYPNGVAADFVRYLFSDLGSAEWPVAFGEGDVEQMEAMGQVPLPPNVVISAHERQYPDRKELVITAVAGLIQVRGYLPQETEPNFVDEWELGTASTSPEVVPLCESNIDMGLGIDLEPQPPMP
ncbi:hypothetical protein [Prochlorothrix hollandica]|nr:hypothetical protein [Prochlorothrix hollandica]